MSKSSHYFVMMLLAFSFSAAGSDLTTTIESGNIDQVKQLLTSVPEEINDKDESGLAPLHVAVNSNKLEVAEYLLESGADVGIRNQYERTPLLCVAFMNGSVEMASLLIKHGADVNAADVQGATPLMLASRTIPRAKKKRRESKTPAAKNFVA